MSRQPKDPFAIRIIEQLLRLRAANALPLTEIAPGRGVWRYAFRVGGQPVTCDLDTIVLEIRVYHHRDEVAMSPLTSELMAMLLGRIPMNTELPAGTEADIVRELRKVIVDWRDGNARIFMRPPVKVGHPDNWNHA
jgi:hypothetical protein